MAGYAHSSKRGLWEARALCDEYYERWNSFVMNIFLQSAPDPSTAERGSLKVSIKRVTVDHGEEVIITIIFPCYIQ